MDYVEYQKAKKANKKSIRNERVKLYEEIEKDFEGKFKKRIIYLNYKNKNWDDRKGWYSYYDIMEFEECSLNFAQLSKRINYVDQKVGRIFTIEEAIKKPRKSDRRVIKDYSGAEYRAILKKRMLEDIDNFKDFMRLMPVGSMVDEALIMQSREIK